MQELIQLNTWYNQHHKQQGGGFRAGFVSLNFKVMKKKKSIKKAIKKIIVSTLKVRMTQNMGGPTQSRFVGEIWKVSEKEAISLVKNDFAEHCEQTLEACNVK